MAEVVCPADFSYEIYFESNLPAGTGSHKLFQRQFNLYVCSGLCSLLRFIR